MSSERLHAADQDRVPSRSAARPAVAPSSGPGAEVRRLPDALGLLGCADGATRHRMAASLQAAYGNREVQRLLDSTGPVVQRWPVTLAPSESNCLTVADHVSANSPYKPKGWAKTKVAFDWTATPQYTTADGKTTATVTAPAVTKSAKVDMPTWAPTDPTMKKAWTTAMGELRAHEALHEGVADTWKENLTSNLSGLTVAVPKQSDADFRAAVGRSWSGWMPSTRRTRMRSTRSA